MNSVTTLTMSYDGNTGGLTGKSDAGTFTYDAFEKPYAIKSIDPTTGLVPDSTQTIGYTSFNKLGSISENGYETDFIYGSDDQRSRMIVKQNGNTILTRWYPTGSYVKETSGGVTKEYTFIGGDAYTAPVAAITQGGTTTYYNLLRDHLGSITHVVSSSGSVVAEYSYDAWGRMRNPSTWTNYEPGSEPALMIAGRGFTGHEHLPWFNTINMNGRLYDPLTGMFLSPDNYVQSGDNSQNFNRYSYGLNNPLRYSDPSGMLIEPRPNPADAGYPFNPEAAAWLDNYNSEFYSRFFGASGDYVSDYIYRSNEQFYGWSKCSDTGPWINNFTGEASWKDPDTRSSQNSGTIPQAGNLSYQTCTSIKVANDNIGGYSVMFEFSTGMYLYWAENRTLPNPLLFYYIHFIPGTAESEGSLTGEVFIFGVKGFGVGLENSPGTIRFTNGIYNGSEISLKYYSSGWTGGSKAGITTYNLSTWGGRIAKGSIAVSVGFGAYNVYRGYQADGGTYGINAQVATGQAVGGIAGGWVGAEGGALAGAAIGAWFGGFGAIPGAIIGGIIGGIGGGWAGSELGGAAALQIRR